MQLPHVDPNGRSIDQESDQAVDQAAKPKRGAGHRGVSLIKPSDQAQTGWRLRWRDTETSKWKTRTLDSQEAKTADTRRAAATKLQRSLRRRKEDIGAGATPHTDADRLLTDAIEEYFTKSAATLAEETVSDYRLAADAFLGWAEQEGIRTCRQLTKGKLSDFPAHAAALPKRVRKTGGKRGEMTTKGKVSRHTANKTIRTVALILNALRRKEVIRLSSDEISDSLKRLKAPVHLKDFLRPQQIAKLLDACRQHDAAMFKATRGEHAASRKAKPPKTPRWPAITEYVEFLLFTGVRLEESLLITGSMVHVETHEILMPAEICKWQLARAVDLSLSTTLMKRTKKWSKLSGPLFPHLTEGKIGTALRRMAKKFDAPKVNPHMLRRCTGTYIANMPVHGPWKATKQLGHRSMATAEKHYLNEIKLDPDFRTMEAAMQLL